MTLEEAAEKIRKARETERCVSEDFAPGNPHNPVAKGWAEDAVRLMKMRIFIPR